MNNNTNLVITRFAPSPTGFLHIGGVRTALFSYLFSRHNKGKFLLRIEDTDNKRLVKESIDSIIDGLKWLGLEYDGFSLQSQNIETHLKYIAKLISLKYAYYCYCSEEELNLEKENMGSFGFKYSGKCSKNIEKYNNLSEEECLKELRRIYSDDKIKNKPVIRFDSSSFEKIEFHDLILGDAVYEKDNLDDFILLKSSFSPTFMFAVVIDDIISKCNFIIRGNDHHTNTAKHLMIYDALNEKRPQYAHLPLIMSEDGTKMSKRKNATDIMDYKKLGFLPEAILNYLLLLGFSPKNNKEFLNKDAMIQEFDINKIHSSPARFDSLKLKKINQHYIIERFNQSNESIQKILIEENFYFTNEINNIKIIYNQKTKDNILKSLSEIIKRIFILSEIINISTFYFENWYDFFDLDATNFIKLNQKIFSKELFELINYEFNINKDNFKKEQISDIISNISNKLNLKKSDIMKAFRCIFTGIINSYSIAFIIEIIGFNESISRMKIFQEKFSILN